MRLTVLMWLAAVMTIPATAAQAPAEADATPVLRPAATMSELMSDVIYPTSDAVLYITTRTPQSEEEWNVLQMKALMLAESGNLLMLPGRARQGEGWMREAKAMYDAGAAAYRAAKARDVEALAALNDPLYRACVNCHREYRPNYGRR
jgi:hypothetical protein